MNKNDAKKFVRNLISDRPWEPKVSTLNKLTLAFLKEYGNAKPARDEIQEAEAFIKDAIDELQWNLELKVVAGLGWKAHDSVEFMFQAQ